MFGKTLSILFLSLIGSANSIGQESRSIDSPNKSYIDSIIKAEMYQEANKLLNTHLNYYFEKNVDSLPNYVRLVGNYALAKNQWNIAASRAEKLVDKIKQVSEPSTQIKALIELSNLYFDARFHQKNYAVSQEALKMERERDRPEAATISLLEYNIGNALLYMGDNASARNHFEKSKNILENNPNIEPEQFFNTYNNLGRIYANISQIDSSNFYYNKALTLLDRFKNSDPDIYYRKAIIENNLSLNHQNTGQTKKAIETLQLAAEHFQKYTETGDDKSKKIRAKRNRLIAIDNLGTFFSGMGEHAKSLELIKLSYRQKKSYLPEEDPDIVISKILLAEAHFAAKDYIKANKYINQVLNHIKKKPERLAYVESYSKTLKASIADALGNYEEAASFYEISESVLAKESSRDFLREELNGFIRMSKFYAKIGQNQKAMQLATIGYDYAHRPNFQNLLVKIAHIKNLAELHLKFGDYQKALKYSEIGLSYYSSDELKTTNVSDAVQITYEKPILLLVRAKSKHGLEKNKSVAFLSSLLKDLETGVTILDTRRSTIKTTKDLNILLIENQDFFDFLKEIHLEFYQLTTDKKYLQKLLEINESFIYNKIRTRLNSTENIRFKNVSKAVIEREDVLKKKLLQPINNNSDITGYLSNNQVWMGFLDSLKKSHTDYYNLKYGAITEALNDVSKNIPSQTTLVRYFHSNNKENLYAYVTDGKFSELFPLKVRGVYKKIEQLNNFDIELKNVSDILEELYMQLWKPFESKITSENIIIFPDAELFNLNFELLVPEKITSFKELASKSLLSKYNISYNYSLYLIANDQKTTDFKKKYLGFAPEFGSQMKNDYQMAITDSIHLDQTYLTLLPQPFSSNLVKKFSKRYQGSSFINERASKKIFIKNAKEHKIIHIGTHAESNNLSPELSRLVFAKNVSDSANINDNYLYTYEIYNQDLSSNLAILTACETGKPTYQPGEGMISLAHAFNYAGSESILTSLWQIDEQSSTQILEYFYTYLEDGLAKDEALRKAKLDYLATAEGRTLHPQYWAGLVLMGDTNPISLPPSTPWFWWSLTCLIIIGGIFFFFKKSRFS